MLPGSASRSCGGFFDLDGRRTKVGELEAKTARPGFWDSNESAQKVVKEIALQKGWIDRYGKVASALEEVEVHYDLADESADAQAYKEAAEAYDQFCIALDDFELTTLLSERDDRRGAILTVHPGAGGTESQDWAEMLWRMYMRWIERKGYGADVIDLQSGEEAGIKSAAVEISGEYAYGFLKNESGVHRLVRISPFDANKRRHTSFASVFVYPEVEDDVELEINDADLRVDTYRASGAGGQHVNKTSSAVRITHEPSGIVVQCQSERSQHKNRASAMRVLRARLYQLKLEEEAQKRSKLEKSKKKIEWGSQIRSYVFHPYTMVKDHRTGCETPKVQSVMDGEIDEFIHAELTGAEKGK
jgi:peptide chain release factor 2